MAQLGTNVGFNGGSAVWKRLDSLTRAGVGTKAIVAYVTDETGLHLREGDELICDASAATIAAGSTDPLALLQLLKAGVSIWSMPGLHAKVVVTDKCITVGSMNASKSSRKSLIEASLDTTDRNAISSALQWMEDLKAHPAARPLTQRDAKALIKSFRPIERLPSSRPPNIPRSDSQAEAGAWIFLQFAEESEVEHLEEGESIVADAEATAGGSNFYHTFYEQDGTRGSSTEKMRVGDLIFEISMGGRAQDNVVWEAGTIWKIVKFPDGLAQIHCRWNLGAEERALPLGDCASAFADIGVKIAELGDDHRLSDKQVRRLERLWRRR